MSHLERGVHSPADVHLEGHMEGSWEVDGVRSKHDISDLGDICLGVSTVFKHILWLRAASLFGDEKGMNLLEETLRRVVVRELPDIMCECLLEN